MCASASELRLKPNRQRDRDSIYGGHAPTDLYSGGDSALGEPRAPPLFAMTVVAARRQTFRSRCSEGQVTTLPEINRLQKSLRADAQFSRSEPQLPRSSDLQPSRPRPPPRSSESQRPPSLAALQPPPQGQLLGARMRGSHLVASVPPSAGRLETGAPACDRDVLKRSSKASSRRASPSGSPTLRALRAQASMQSDAILRARMRDVHEREVIWDRDGRRHRSLGAASLAGARADGGGGGTAAAAARADRQDDLSPRSNPATKTAAQRIPDHLKSISDGCQAVRRCNATDIAAGDLHALQEVSAAARRIVEDIVRMQEEQWVAKTLPSKDSRGDSGKAEMQISEASTATSVSAQDGLAGFGEEMRRRASMRPRMLCDINHAQADLSNAMVPMGSVGSDGGRRSCASAAGHRGRIRSFLAHGPDAEALDVGAAVGAGVEGGRRRNSSGSIETSTAVTVSDEPEGDAVHFQKQRTSYYQARAVETNLHSAFNRFRLPGTSDLHKEDLCMVTQFLGHVIHVDERVRQLAQDVTPYDYMDFSELSTFMEKFLDYEFERFHDAFEEFDADASGYMSCQEIMPLMVHLGYMPTHRMVRETLAQVDQDGSGELDFKELVRFLTLFREREGFTEAEIQRAMGIFEDFAAPPGAAAARLMPAKSVSAALTHVFGLHVMSTATQLEAEVLAGGGATRPSHGSPHRAVGAVGDEEPEGVPFPEFLIFCRRIRELQLEHVRGKFRGYDAEGHEVSGNDLCRALQCYGHSPVHTVVVEILKEVSDDLVFIRKSNWTLNRGLLFREFFDFVMMYCQRDGFSSTEVEEFDRVFQRFDEDNSREVDVLELGNVLRYLGYNTNIDDIHLHVTEVDANESGELGFPEFLRLMRRHRQDEIAKIRQAFSKYSGGPALALTSTKISAALTEVEQDPPKAILGAAVSAAATGGGYELAGFVKLVDDCRAARVAKERKRVGFTEAEVNSLKEQFESFDKDKSGEIDCGELQNLLQALGWQPKDREERDKLVCRLEAARSAAKEAGVEDVGMPGSTSVTFWVFVQLLRVVQNQRTKAEEDKMARLMRELHFTPQEVEQFRQIFFSWIRREEVADEVSPGQAAPSDRMPLDTVRRLIRSLGMSNVRGENRSRLERKMRDLDADGSGLQFGEFLRLMRWLLDADFAGIASGSK